MNLKLWKWNNERHEELMGKSNHKDKCHLPHNFNKIWSFLRHDQEEQKQAFDFLEIAMVFDAFKSLSTSKTTSVLNIYTNLGCNLVISLTWENETCQHMEAKFWAVGMNESEKEKN